MRVSKTFSITFELQSGRPWLREEKKNHLRRNEILKLKYYFNNDELKRQVSVEIQKAVIKNERARGKTKEKE